MKSNICKSVIMVSVCIFALSSCALPPPGQPLTESERRNAKISCFAQYSLGGALLGAGGGALLEKIRGGDVKEGAEIGAAAGAVLGFATAWGKCFYLFSEVSSQPVEGYKTKTSKTYNVKIENFSISPSTAYAGDTISLNGSYIVAAPKGVADLNVKETQILEVYDEEGKKFVNVGEVPTEITAAAGILRKIQGNVDIPTQAVPGRFRISYMVTSQGKIDVVSKELHIGKRG